ncbi:MAG: hypothetical protein J1E64_08325 [Acetatifactor sp.]|nr:hypothetical protein [Acetatifactor sp.]
MRTVRCPRCSMTIPDDSRYCTACGKAISEEAKQERKERRKRIGLIFLAVLVAIGGWLGARILYLPNHTYTSADGLYRAKLSDYWERVKGTVNVDGETTIRRIAEMSISRSSKSPNYTFYTHGGDCDIYLTIPIELYNSGQIIQMNDSSEEVDLEINIDGKSVNVVWTDWRIQLEEINSVLSTDFGAVRFYFEFKYNGQSYEIDGFGAYESSIK